MSEHLKNNSSNYEKPEPTRRTIDELLPRYYEAHGDRLVYETVRSMPMDGHDVAWMKYTGQHTSGHVLHCACEFAEDVSWRVEDGEVVNFGQAEDDCLPRKAALYLRQQELKQEYIERLTGDDLFFHDEYGLREHLPEIILDLIEKDKEGEFIGDIATNGAHFWGGHFYLDTVRAITNTPWDQLWEVANQMVYDKQIQIDGSVVQEYYEPSEPEWREYRRFSHEGYTGVAHLPARDDMPQQWEITILAQNGRIIAEGIKGPELTRELTTDIASVEGAIHHVIEQYLWDPTSQA